MWKWRRSAALCVFVSLVYELFIFDQKRFSIYWLDYIVGYNSIYLGIDQDHEISLADKNVSNR